MKCKIFRNRAGATNKLETEINDWLEMEKAIILFTSQSQGGEPGAEFITITVFYKQEKLK